MIQFEDLPAVKALRAKEAKSTGPRELEALDRTRALLSARWEEAAENADEGVSISYDLTKALIAAIDTATDALSRSSVPEGWRPIETAPKDGTVIIAYGTQCIDGLTPPEPFLDTVWWQAGLWQDGSIADCPKLTHWMPLPAPPATPGLSGGSEGTKEDGSSQDAESGRGTTASPPERSEP